MRYVSGKGFVAIVPPVLNKADTEHRAGLALNTSRSQVIKADLVMDYLLQFASGNPQRVIAGTDKVIIRGDSGAKPWAKQIFNVDGKDFVLCPESEILGFVRENE
jgi:hypothetical protein